MTNFEDWFVGFTDGEGSFIISFFRHPRVQYGIEVRAGFSITQYDLDILMKIHDFFGFGTIAPLHKKSGFYYSVASIKDCLALVDFFDSNPLLSKKLDDYKIWKECVLKIKNLEHRTSNGILEIAKLREKMNLKTSRNRLSFDEIKKVVENKIKAM